MDISTQLDTLQRDRYSGLMEIIRIRLETTEAILSESNGTLYAYLNIEDVAFQFRKILEAIAMSSLVANTKKFTKILIHIGMRRE